MSDQLSPNFLIVEPDGSIGAELTGHLRARGIDIDVAENPTPPAQQRIRWLQQADGALIASAWGYESQDPVVYGCAMTAQNPDASEFASLFVEVDDATDTTSVQITTQAPGAGGNVLVFRSDGASGFWQGRPSHNAGRIYGSAGVAISVAAGDSDTFDIDFPGFDPSVAIGYALVGYLVNGSFMDWCGWCSAGAGVGYVTISVHNNAPFDADGSFYGYLITDH